MSTRRISQFKKSTRSVGSGPMPRVDPYSKEAVGKRLGLVRLAIMDGDEKSQARFSKMLGLSPSQWNNAETGDNFPGKAVLDALRLKYGIGADYVLYDDNRALPREYADWIANRQAKKAVKRA